MKIILLSVVTVPGLALFSSCATMLQTWPNYERNTENKTGNFKSRSFLNGWKLFTGKFH